MLLEICANSYQSAKNAQEAGAHRIELCAELAVGGITPSYGLLKKVAENLTIKTFVLIRPRSGNFTYSDTEFEQMKLDIELCKKFGCKGIVSGVLNSDNTIDLVRTKELIAVAKPLEFTFHRAFDCVPNPQEALQKLIDLGADRVLTSGQAVSAEKGISLLKELHEISSGKLIILAGAGINAKNATKFKAIGLQEVHTSASKTIENEVKPSVFDTVLTISDKEKIKTILKQITS